MRRLFLVMLLSLTACAERVTWEETLADLDRLSNSVPAQITNLRLTPDSARLNAGGGEITASAEFDYYDADGNSFGFTIVVEDAAGTETTFVHEFVSPPSTNATLQGSFSVDTTTIQLCTVSVTVYGMNDSNTLQSDFVVYGP